MVFSLSLNSFIGTADSDAMKITNFLILRSKFADKRMTGEYCLLACHQWFFWLHGPSSLAACRSKCSFILRSSRNDGKKVGFVSGK